MWTNRGSQEPALVYNVIAAENLGVGNVVVIKDDGTGVKRAYLATSAVYVFGDPLGIVLSAAQTGVSARVVLEGRVENGAWSFGPADKFVYLSNSGYVTSSAMSVKLGYALSSTAIYFKPSSAGGGQTDTVTGANGIQNTGNDINAVIAPVYGAAANTIAEGNHNHDAAYSPIAKGVTNGDSHDHNGGDGSAIPLGSGVTGILPIANGGTGSSDAGFDVLRKMRHCAATGTDTIALSVLSGPNPTAYAIGQEFTFIEPAGGNASANPTVNVGGLGALALTMGGVSIPAGGLKSLNIYRVIVTSSVGFTATIAPYDALSAQGGIINGNLAITGNTQVTALNGGPFAKNIVINGGFTINQRGYVSSATLASGAYGHDRWKAGAGGGDYSFTQLASATTI
ncbi:MAG: hypothetical protein HQK86_15000, partial [Nitrospinae bacterium]|nr:hypothetical protein [Nitrospinota bacterium]